MLSQPWVSSARAVSSSAERKAIEAAQMVAGHPSLSPVVIDSLGENDRLATGYQPRVEFGRVADNFFACPEKSVRGWERAIDAQRRIAEAVNQATSLVAADTDIAIISHGAVGALLLCHRKGVPISRREDQPSGGAGTIYSFDVATRRLLTEWHRIDE